MATFPIRIIPFRLFALTTNPGIRELTNNYG
jgi:hypothetical protein